jgi:hypothetical protein
MSWRSTQLGDNLCDQDQLIIDLFKNQSVKYVGSDCEFAQHLNSDNKSNNLILILDQPVWVSDLYKILCKNLLTPVDKFYIGINRYVILGNDTDIVIENINQHGTDIIQLVARIITKLNYTIIDQGTYDNDRGRYFNFVQPLTWIYGSYVTDQSNQH